MINIREKIGELFPVQERGERVMVKGRDVAQGAKALYKLLTYLKAEILDDEFAENEELYHAISSDPALLARFGFKALLVPEMKDVPKEYVKISKKEASKFIHGAKMEAFPGHILWAMRESMTENLESLDLFKLLSILGFFYLEVKGFSELSGDTTEYKLVRRILEGILVQNIDKLKILI